MDRWTAIVIIVIALFTFILLGLYFKLITDWVIPAISVIGVAFVVGGGMYFSHGRK